MSSSLLEKIRSWLAGGIEQQLHRLDPQQRRDLVAEVEASLDVSAPSVINDISGVHNPLHTNETAVIQEITEALENARRQLIKMEEMELFINLRVTAYMKALDGVDCRLHQDEKGTHLSHSINESSRLTSVRQQLESCEEQLEDIMRAQKNLLVNIQLQKRRIEGMEQRRDELIQKHEECLKVLNASAKIDLSETNYKCEKLASHSMKDESVSLV